MGSLILGILALPVIVIGLIDPLEGGLALLVVMALGVVTRLLSGILAPRLAWMSMAVTPPVLTGYACYLVSLAPALSDLRGQSLESVTP